MTWGFAIFVVIVAAWLMLRNSPRMRSNRPSYESRYVVRVTGDTVVCTDPKGKTVALDWRLLQRFEVITTDEGPFAPDVFWVLIGPDQPLIIPQGATGGTELLELAQKLPSFDSLAFAEAMSSTENRKFICWQKPYPPMKLA